MINVQENGQEGGQAQVRAKAVLSLFRSSCSKGELHEVEQASIKSVFQSISWQPNALEI